MTIQIEPAPAVANEIKDRIVSAKNLGTKVGVRVPQKYTQFTQQLARTLHPRRPVRVVPCTDVSLEYLPQSNRDNKWRGPVPGALPK